MGCELPCTTSPPDRQMMVDLTVRTHAILGRQLGRDLFTMPALDMLLDLYAREERRPRSLSRVCAASKAPARTALRIINRLVERGLIVRVPDPLDARRINVSLSPNAIKLLDAIFDDLLEQLGGRV